MKKGLYEEEDGPLCEAMKVMLLGVMAVIGAIAIVVTGHILLHLLMD